MSDLEYRQVDDPRHASILQHACQKALGLVKRCPDYRPRLNTMVIKHLAWEHPQIDTEASLHTCDQRDICYIKAVSDDTTAEFSIDVVHESGHRDRRSHSISYEVSHRGHVFMGTAIVPLEHEKMEPVLYPWPTHHDEEPLDD